VTDRTFLGAVMAGMAHAVPMATVLLLAAGSAQPGAENMRRPPCCRATQARPLPADARTVRRRRSGARLPLALLL
jgi:hypothetical protein